MPFARRRVHETHGALSGVVLGGTIGLGFTLTEDILYIVGAAEKAGGAGFIGVFFIRTIMLGMGHATFTAFTGLGFGLFATMTSGWRWAMPWLGLGAAMIAHAGRNLFSSFLTLDGFGVVMVLVAACAGDADVLWIIDRDGLSGSQTSAGRVGRRGGRFDHEGGVRMHHQLLDAFARMELHSTHGPAGRLSGGAREAVALFSIGVHTQSGTE